MSVINLIVNQNSPDNNVRTSAELEFNLLLSKNPSEVAYTLIQLAMSEDFPVDIRQACLLHMKRLVPKYWSIAFQSFVGPPINQELKQAIRLNLLNISTSSTSTKVRNGSTYAIVQIASADYPDEWPDLLNQLYQLTTNFTNEISVIGGLDVLNDLFDDLVTEEQFWEGGIGNEVINHIMKILSQGGLNPDIKTSALRLYQNVLTTLQSPEAFADPHRKNFIYQHMNDALPVLANLLPTTLEGDISLAELNLKSYVHRTLGTLIGHFNKKISQDIKRLFLTLALKDFSKYTDIYKSLNVKFITTQELQDPSKTLTFLLKDILQTLLLVQHGVKIFSEPNNFIENLVNASIISDDLIEEYESDINIYVSEITGLATSPTVRDSVYELVSELNLQDGQVLFGSIIEQFEQSQGNWKLQEAYLFILEALFVNEDLDINTPLASLLQLLTSPITPQNSGYVISRCYLVLPRFFEKFESKISVQTFGIKSFVDMIEFASQQTKSEIVNVTALVSSTLYRNLFDIGQLLESPQKNEIQQRIFQLIYSSIEDSEDDGLPILLEAISSSTNIDPVFASTLVVEAGVNVIDLIFKISFKDSSNIQLTIDASESLGFLLEQISFNDYLLCCEKSLPFIINLIQNEIQKANAEYSPDLYLSLELLSIIINSVPTSTEVDFPPQVFNYTFPALHKLLLITLDNQILQSGGEVFNNMLKRASKLFIDYVDPETKETGMNILLNIVSKFLSPELSDSAALNCGDIVASLIEQFQAYLGNEYLSQVLEATVRRLLIAKETMTIENLIMVFTKLILNSPSEMIDFLSEGISLPHPVTNIQLNGLLLILPIWFESFEVTRGYEKIKQNTIALAKIFTLNDARVNAVTVNGDIIPYQGDLIRTRSITKSMPDQYTQIPAPLKIVKLFIGELEFQSQQPDANDFLPEEAEDEADDGEGWEDMGDIGVPNYEKLKSYVDSDNEDDGIEDQGDDDSLKKILVQFFKECTAKNLGDFQMYYESLSQEEKKIVAENVVFD